MINKKGVALVIANSAYITQPKLKSCKKDGEDMRGALERLNFDVFFAENQNRAELFNIISDFLRMQTYIRQCCFIIRDMVYK